VDASNIISVNYQYFPQRERERCFASSRKTAGTRDDATSNSNYDPDSYNWISLGSLASRSSRCAICDKTETGFPRRGEALCAEPAKKAIPQNRDSVRPVFPRSGTHAKTVRYVRSIKPIWSESLESSISIRSPIRDCYERDGNTRQLLASTLAFGIRERANRLLIKMEITR